MVAMVQVNKQRVRERDNLCKSAGGDRRLADRTLQSQFHRICGQVSSRMKFQLLIVFFFFHPSIHFAYLRVSEVKKTVY